MTSMDLSLFIFFVSLAIVLFILSWIFSGGIRVGLGMLSAGFFMLIGLAIGTGTDITSTIVFDTVTSVTIPLDLGIQSEHVMMFFVMMGLVAMFASIWDYAFY